MSFDFSAIPSQKGRLAVVTGANTGLGFETVKWFVQKNLKVIMACRSLEKAERAKANILSEFPQADLAIMHVDLSSLDSVRQFAAQFNAQYDRLDLLINNAGIMMPPYAQNEDGFESQMGANHFGHFLLTHLLLPRLKVTPGSRVVALSSLAHRSGEIHFDDLHWEKDYARNGAYGQSKLANLMFALELQRRLAQEGQNTIAVAAHPGISMTELSRHLPKLTYYLLLPLAFFIAQSPKEGALPTVMAALHPEVKGGSYFGPQGLSEMKGKPGLAKIAQQAKDEAAAHKLWEVSAQLTGVA